MRNKTALQSFLSVHLKELSVNCLGGMVQAMMDLPSPQTDVILKEDNCLELVTPRALARGLGFHDDFSLPTHDLTAFHLLGCSLSPIMCFGWIQAACTILASPRSDASMQCQALMQRCIPQGFISPCTNHAVLTLTLSMRGRMPPLQTAQLTGVNIDTVQALLQHGEPDIIPLLRPTYHAGIVSPLDFCGIFQC